MNNTEITETTDVLYQRFSFIADKGQEPLRIDNIIPCGIQHKKVTSMKKELGRDLLITEVKEKLKKSFENVFDVVITDDQKSLVK